VTTGVCGGEEDGERTWPSTTVAGRGGVGGKVAGLGGGVGGMFTGR